MDWRSNRVALAAFAMRKNSDGLSDGGRPDGLELCSAAVVNKRPVPPVQREREREREREIKGGRLHAIL